MEKPTTSIIPSAQTTIPAKKVPKSVLTKAFAMPMPDEEGPQPAPSWAEVNLQPILIDSPFPSRSSAGSPPLSPLVE